METNEIVPILSSPHVVLVCDEVDRLIEVHGDPSHSQYNLHFMLLNLKEVFSSISVVSRMERMPHRELDFLYDEIVDTFYKIELLFSTYPHDKVFIYRESLNLINKLLKHVQS